MDFDYIVIGSGCGGAVCARHLADAFPTKSILILEAGPSFSELDPSIVKDLESPSRWASLWNNSKIDYEIVTERQPGLDGRRVAFAQGRVLGGSSSINAGMFVKGLQSDFDHWADLCNSAEWRFKNVADKFPANMHDAQSGVAKSSSWLASAFVRSCAESNVCPTVGDYNESCMGGCSATSFSFGVSPSGSPMRINVFDVFLKDRCVLNLKPEQAFVRRPESPNSDGGLLEDVVSLSKFVTAKLGYRRPSSSSSAASTATTSSALSPPTSMVSPWSTAGAAPDIARPAMGSVAGLQAGTARSAPSRHPPLSHSRFPDSLSSSDEYVSERDAATDLDAQSEDSDVLDSLAASAAGAGAGASGSVFGDALPAGDMSDSAAAAARSTSAKLRNIHVWTQCQAIRIEFSRDLCAKSVLLLDRSISPEKGGVIRRVCVTSGEVICCGGALFTPQLLMLSGIGPKEELSRHNIPVVARNEFVGRNLQDHVLCGMFGWANKSLRTKRPDQAGKQRLTNGQDAAAFLHVCDQDPVEIVCVDGSVSLIHALPAMVANKICSSSAIADNLSERSYRKVLRATKSLLDVVFFVLYPLFWLILSRIVVLFVIPGNPKSRGDLKLRSSRISDQPVIDPGYLTDPADGRVLTAGLERAYSVMSHPSFPVRPLWPLPGVASSVEGLERHGRTEAVSSWHPCSTCALGSALDSQLRVRGVKGLRVADASAMPRVVAGNTQAAVMLIGAMAGRFLVEEASGSPKSLK